MPGSTVIVKVITAMTNHVSRHPTSRSSNATNSGIDKAANPGPAVANAIARPRLLRNHFGITGVAATRGCPMLDSPPMTPKRMKNCQCSSTCELRARLAVANRPPAIVSTRAPFHMEGGKGTKSKVVKFQIRPDPLAR